MELNESSKNQSPGPVYTSFLKCLIMFLSCWVIIFTNGPLSSSLLSLAVSRGILTTSHISVFIFLFFKQSWEFLPTYSLVPHMSDQSYCMFCLWFILPSGNLECLQTVQYFKLILSLLLPASLSENQVRTAALWTSFSLTFLLLLLYWSYAFCLPTSFTIVSPLY